MKIIEKHWEQFVPAGIDEVWAFFSRPENLNRITPPDMDFEILSDLSGVEMYPGMLIRYRIRPMFKLPMQWVTEITQIAEGRYFIDEQRFGPYAFWHHQHHFEARDGGVIMRDILHYAVPFGLLGTAVNRLLIEDKVEAIFRYRKKVIDQLYPAPVAQTPAESGSVLS